MATTTEFFTGLKTTMTLTGRAAIDAGESETLPIPNNGRAVVRLAIPDGFDGTAISFTVQAFPRSGLISEADFLPVVDRTGAAVSYTVPSGGSVIEVGELSGCYAFTVVSNDTETDAQVIDVDCQGDNPVPFEAAAGGGLTPAGTTPTRVSVTDLKQWGSGGGTDYYGVFGPRSLVPGGVLAPPLADFGWTVTSAGLTLIETPGSGGGVLAYDIGSPAHVLATASGALLQSPSVFGGIHSLQGKYMTDPADSNLTSQAVAMTIEIAGAFTVVSGNEPTRSGFGLVQSGGVAGVAADRAAWIGSNGTNFVAGNTIASVTGPLVDTAFHIHRLRYLASTGNWTWTIDYNGQAEGSFEAEVDSPMSFGMFAFTTNRPGIAWVRVAYDYLT